jgi:hypothetical protein
MNRSPSASRAKANPHALSATTSATPPGLKAEAQSKYWNARRLVALAVLGPLVAWLCFIHPLLVFEAFVILLLALGVLIFAIEIFSAKKPRSEPSATGSSAAWLFILVAAFVTGWWLRGDNDC